MADRIEIVDYDPAWPGQFAKETRAVRRALGKPALAVEHIGSTAVPGLAAKPTLDLMIGTDELALGPREIAAMKRLGYEHLGEYGLPGRQFFRKGLPPTHHVHWVRRGADFWAKQLVFRDFLRAHHGRAEDYGRHKRELAREHSRDRAGYTAAKTDFILRLQESAWRWAKADLIVLDLEATCWDGGQPPEKMETIEIGAVRLGPDLKPNGEFACFIKPRDEPALSDFCTKLTSIRQMDVDAAPPFPLALRDFSRWIGRGLYRLASWSAYDLHQLRLDSARHGFTLAPELERHLDLQDAHARLRKTKPVPMTSAMKGDGLVYKGRLHTGIDDARNAALLAAAMLREMVL